MLTNCWKCCLSFYSTFAPFLPWGFMPGFEESNFSSSVANSSCFFRFISSNTFPHQLFFFLASSRSRETWSHTSLQSNSPLVFYNNSHHAATLHWVLLCLQSFLLRKNTERACIKGVSLYFSKLSPNDKTSCETEQVYRRSKEPTETLVFVSPFFLCCGSPRSFQNSAYLAHVKTDESPEEFRRDLGQTHPRSYFYSFRKINFFQGQRSKTWRLQPTTPSHDHLQEVHNLHN